MILYSGLGFLTLLLFFLPIAVIGLGGEALGINVLDATPWGYHAAFLLGAILTFMTGKYLNRKPAYQIVYEPTGPTQVAKARHTLYFIRMEYWGPIGFLIYVALFAVRGH